MAKPVGEADGTGSASEAGEASYHSKADRNVVSPGSAMKLLEAQESGRRGEEDKNNRTPITPFGKHDQEGCLPLHIKGAPHAKCRICNDALS